MSAMLLHEGDVIIREERALRRITLNRPKALNALTLDMAVTMTALLRSWAADPAVGAVLIDGAGERGLLRRRRHSRALRRGEVRQLRSPQQFWSTEYHLNVLIARYPKPVIAVMDGLVMGGGVGLSAHAAHRVVTDRSAVAMPEVGIGFFPDVGASFLLARAPGHVGRYLGAHRRSRGAADAIYCGFADIHVPAAKLAEIPAALADCRTGRRRQEAARRYVRLRPRPAGSQRRRPGSTAASTPIASRHFRSPAVEQSGARPSALATMHKASPTSLKITLRNLREPRHLQKR